jgi:hypothetical protein
MAAETTVNVSVELTGLGLPRDFVDKSTDGTTPTAATYNYRVLATGDAAEALDLGDITTEAILVIRAIDYDLDIDLDFVSSFDADLTVKAGEPAALIPNPAGVVYVKNNGAAETPAYEYLLIGTT